MTENDNQKLDLIMKMIEQQDKRSDQIVSMIEQQDKRFEQMDKRFEQMEEARREDRAEMARRFEQMDKRFEQMEEARREDRAEIVRRFDEVKHDLRLDSRKLEQVYEARERVKITFGWQWGMASMFIAIVAAGITKIFS